ncbi:MAG: CDGSH iron-sulfur domain-containing protein, partial [Candidatus Obscuribacterales bacterium]|nr:CDGSH iron-sulfur domain-containing protein [Candidatus Obscuribacterales bacterium]
LHRAIKAADWITANRVIDSGGFRHDESDKVGPYLDDTLAMGQAFLNLHEASADCKGLSKSEACADFISAHFSDVAIAGGEDQKKAGSLNQAGSLTADAKMSKVVRPLPLLEENVRLVRFANLLAHYIGNKKYQKMARSGSEKDEEARALFIAAIKARRSIVGSNGMTGKKVNCPIWKSTIPSFRRRLHSPVGKVSVRLRLSRASRSKACSSLETYSWVLKTFAKVCKNVLSLISGVCQMTDRVIADRKPCVLKLEPGNYAWCACGRSSKQPFCDGSHAGTEFSPVRFTVDAETTMALCMCKHTKTEPRCDGTHSSLPLAD